MTEILERAKQMRTVTQLNALGIPDGTNGQCAHCGRRRVKEGVAWRHLARIRGGCSDTGGALTVHPKWLEASHD